MITRTTAKLGYQTYTAQRDTGHTKESLRRFYHDWQDFEVWYHDDKYDPLDPHGEKAARLRSSADSRSEARWRKETK